jgi:hypothetical protein
MNRRLAAILTCALSATAVSSCRDDPRPGPIDLEEASEVYVRAALQLAQHDPHLVEDWRGPPAWRPGPRAPVAGIAATVDRLERDLADRVYPRRDGGRTIPVHHTGGFEAGHYLFWQSRALNLASRRLLGEHTSAVEEVRALFGHIPVPADAPAPAEALAALNRLLPGDAPLADRLIAYRRRLATPDERRLSVFTAALAECRRATQRATRLLPDDESVEVAFVSGLGWDGLARYLGHRRSRIEVNADTPLDVARALRLACHEGYPGHHLQHLLRDTDAARYRAYDLSPAFGPHYVIAEGAAEAATDLVMSTAERERVYRDILMPAAGLPAAEASRLAAIDDLVAETARATTPIVRDYLDGRLSGPAAAERLSHDALIPSPERFLAFVDRVRTRAIVYGEGRLVLRGYLESRGLQDGLWRLFVSRPFALQ